MMNRNLLFSLFVILLPLQPNSAYADEWDLNKTDSLVNPSHLQKWCKPNSNLVRYSNSEVAGYRPCGELKTLVVCDASGKKLISSGPPPYGYKECSGTPRIRIERVGAPIPEDATQENPIALAKNTPSSPSDQISAGLKNYQDYISSLDQITDGSESAPKSKKSSSKVSSLSQLTGSLSPQMLSQVMKMLTSIGQ